MSRISSGLSTEEAVPDAASEKELVGISILKILFIKIMMVMLYCPLILLLNVAFSNSSPRAMSIISKRSIWKQLNATQEALRYHQRQ